MNEIYGAWVSELKVKPAKAAFAAAALPAGALVEIVVQARDDDMPGSPYFDGTPKASLRGQTTHNCLTYCCLFAIIAWQNEILAEGILTITIGLLILAAIRR